MIPTVRGVPRWTSTCVTGKKDSFHEQAHPEIERAAKEYKPENIPTWSHGRYPRPRSQTQPPKHALAATAQTRRSPVQFPRKGRWIGPTFPRGVGDRRLPTASMARFRQSLLDSMIRTQRAARNSHGVRVVGAAGRPRFMWRGLGGASQSHHLPGPATAEGKLLPDSTMGFHGIGEERPACNPQFRGRPDPQGPRLRRTPRYADVEVTPTCPAPRGQCIPIAFPMFSDPQTLRGLSGEPSQTGLRALRW